MDTGLANTKQAAIIEELKQKGYVICEAPDNKLRAIYLKFKHGDQCTYVRVNGDGEKVYGTNLRMLEFR